jgi:hypothetical protein
MPLTSAGNLESLRDLPTADDATVELGLRIDGRSITVRLSWANGFSDVEIREGDAPFVSVTVPDELARSFVVRAALAASDAGNGGDQDATARHIGYVRWAIGGGAPTGSFSWETFSDQPEALATAIPKLISDIESFVRATKAQLA